MAALERVLDGGSVASSNPASGTSDRSLSESGEESSFVRNDEKKDVNQVMRCGLALLVVYPEMKRGFLVPMPKSCEGVLDSLPPSPFPSLIRLSPTAGGLSPKD
jgi:hypothetical protein